MGPRPRGRGIPHFALQSARFPSCFNGAATARSRNQSACSTVTFDSATLQWGRDRAVAESPALILEHLISPRFNGAATARSRNHGPLLVL